MQEPEILTHKPIAGGAPQSLVVMLHGVGSNGADLLGLAPYFARDLPHTEFVSPDALEPYDMAPFGHQWFSLADRSPPVLLREVRRAEPKVHALLDRLLQERRLDDGKMVLLGFSQGTMMSLHVGLRRTVAPAGIVGFSGALLAGPELLQEVTVRPPVLLIHGTEDPVVPPQAMPAGEAALLAAGVPVETLFCPGLGHSIDEDGIARAAAFLKAALKP